MPAFLWPHPKSDIEKLKAEIKSLDLRSAAASSRDDQDKNMKDMCPKPNRSSRCKMMSKFVAGEDLAGY